MAKYTINDPDIVSLNDADRVDYNFELLKFDVDQNQEAYIAKSSVKFITNPTLIGEMFTSPTNFTTGVLALVIFILTVILIIYLLVYCILLFLGGSKNKIKTDIMFKIFLYMLICMIIIIVLYWLLNKIISTVTATGLVVKV